MKPLTFHALAEEELAAAIRYHESKRKGLGLDLHAEIERALARIRSDPKQFPRYEEEDVQQCIVHRFPYSIMYGELEDRIWIAAVAHHKRKPGYWKRRQP